MTREEFEQYRSMAFSVTLVLFAFQDGELKIFIRKKVQDPFKGAWALPGRLISPEVSLQEASESILEETIGNRNAYLEQLNAWGKLYRHPYGRVIDIAWYGLINLQDDVVTKLSDAQDKLMQSEKMASIGQLAAGVAHEINNPIGFIFSNFGTLERYLGDLFQMLAAYEEAESALAGTPAAARLRALREKIELDFLKEDIP